jgi:hypothetical protein
MATRYWRGASANIKQTYTITVASTWAQGDTCTITIDSIAFVITIGTLVTTTQVATTIKEALSGSSFTDTSASATILPTDGAAAIIPQFSEFTATSSGAVVTLTSNGTSPAALAGKPFTVTSVTEVTAGSGTATGAAGVTATSQWHFDQADNWSGNTVPVDNDTVVFDAGAVDLRYLLTAGIQPATINKYKQYTGNVGLATVNTDNNAKPYSEYRTPRYLTTTNNSVTTTANLETGEGPGSGRFMLDSGAGQAILNVFGKGQRIDTGVPTTIWKGSHASNVVNNPGGDLGIAIFAGETAVVATLVSGDGPASQAATFCGTGVTLTTVRMNGGTITTQSAMTTATQYAGTWDHYTGTVTTLVVHAGATFNARTAMTVTTGTVYGKLDISKSSGTVTFTNLVTVDGDGEIYDPNGRAVFSAGYKLLSAKAKVTRPVGDTHSLS